MNILLDSKKLNKHYKLGKNNRIQVLKNVNLEVLRGEFVTIMGPSGSGKSTLLYNLSGMDQISSGRVNFNGKELSSLSEKSLSALRLKDMGFIFQQIHLLNNLCIQDNITLPGYLCGRKNRKDIVKRAQMLMEMTGIESLAQNDITQASGGQLQRVGICRALINDPEIIFGDEPTGALDSHSSYEIMELLRRINHLGTTVFLVTHDPKVASKSDRVLYMVDGQVVSEKRIGRFMGGKKEVLSREKVLSQWLMDTQNMSLVMEKKNV
jgi:putative ABC transport system ATP-binding protein